MSTPDPIPTASDPHIDAAIARAEGYRVMLEQLAGIGMSIAQEIGERAVNSPYHPEAKHEPGRAFANVSRAIRLTLALAVRFDKDILALRKGHVPAPARVTAIDPHRARVRRAVWTVINREVRDPESATDALDRVHESLIERDDYEDLLDRPWRECVEAICADLGLEPDWGMWSDETGFPELRHWNSKDWPSQWSYDPERPKARRPLGVDVPSG